MDIDPEFAETPINLPAKDKINRITNGLKQHEKIIIGHDSGPQMLAQADNSRKQVMKEMIKDKCRLNISQGNNIRNRKYSGSENNYPYDFN